VATAVCFGQACCVLVLERSLAGTIIQVLRNVNLYSAEQFPSSDYEHRKAEYEKAELSTTKTPEEPEFLKSDYQCLFSL